MNRKKMILCGAVCAILLLSSCEKTPEDLVVTQKNQNNMSDYEKKDSDEKGTLLTKELSVPEAYQDEAQSEDGKLTIAIDAAVEVPDVSQLSVYKVKEKPYDQEFIDRVTKTFFDGGKIYDANEKYKPTKDELAKQIDETKESLATGNYTVPEGMTKEQYEADLLAAIDEREKEYETASETNELSETTPTFIENEINQMYVEMDEQNKYDYKIEDFCGNSIEINKISSVDGNRSAEWIDYQWLNSASQVMSEEQVKALADIEMEEAKAIAEGKVSELGLEDMELYNWDYSILQSSNAINLDEAESKAEGAGYLFHFIRKLDKVPLTYSDESGGDLESMDDNRETRYYEKLNIIVTKDGIAKVDIISLYDVGEKEVEAAQLKDFSEITEIFKNMLLISDSDTSLYDNWRKYSINRITLGYMRVYEPNVDSKSGRLIPVWDFFGGFEGESAEKNEDGTVNSYKEFYNNRSLFTINALDGTVIDRELGY